MRWFNRTALLLLWLTLPACAAGTDLLGDWREPGGAVIRIASCGANLCATLVSLSANAPTHLDLRNPDAARRTQSLCGMVIGTGFRSAGTGRADNGMLYDPRSGKTYHGEMAAEGEELHLRGYVGMRMFGRTQTWTRTSPVAACSG